MNLKLWFTAFACVFATSIHAQDQNFKVTGKIVDNDTKQSMPGVYVTLKNIADSSTLVMATTDKDGLFSFSGLNIRQKYLLIASFLGYSDLKMRIESQTTVKDLGTLSISAKAQAIGEVVVNGDPPASVQKGDTTEMNAGAFKVNKDATAEELLVKMPGITVQNGAYVAHGEQVTKVLVDGKPFFGDDPAVTLKNLPAEVIDKVQIFNKLSEQSELTGFDDGNSAKTINFITKQNRRNGLFGKAFAGSDLKDNLSDRYLLGANANYFKNQQRISFIGLANNINQQNFGSQDLVSSGGGGGRNFVVQQQPGITKTGSVGLNYSNAWGKKINVTASYFFNTSKNDYEELQNIDKLLSPAPDQIEKASTNSDAKNYNNRFNMRLEWDPDTLNTFIMTPKLSFQTNNSNNVMYQGTTLPDNTFVNSSWNNDSVKAYGNSLSSELVYRHKFQKARRTFSIALTPSYSVSNSKTTQSIYNSFSLNDSVPKNQFTDADYTSYGITSNIAYTEPVGKHGMVQLGYNLSFTRNKADKELDSIGNNQTKTRIDSLSSVYQNDYITNRAGLSYRYKLDKVNFSTGVDFQHADLEGTLKYPYPGKVSKPFDNVLPNFLFMYRSGKQSNIRVMYRTSVSPPSITQLQNVLNNSNSPFLTIGNPDLKQQYTHSLMGHIMVSNPDKNLTFSAFLSGNYTLDPIESLTITGLSQRDTFLSVYNVKISKGGSLSIPVNLDKAWSVRSMVNFGFPLKFMLSKLNLLAGLNYSLTPGNNEVLSTGDSKPVTNISRSSALTTGVVLSSNISENTDFTISYTNTYSDVQNSSQTKSNGSYLYQTLNGKINLIIGNGFVLETDALYQINSGLSQNYNQKYVVWNGSFGKKFLKTQNAELKLSVYDLLNQGRNITRTVSPQSIQDVSYNTLPRYYLLTFTYTLRNFKGQEPPHDQRRWGGDGTRGPEPPHDQRGGGEPSRDF